MQNNYNPRPPDDPGDSPGPDPEPTDRDTDREARPCACWRGLVYIGHMVPVEDGEEVEVFVAYPCRRCERTVVMDREKHRLIHQSDWQRWGRRGGMATLRRYGSDWMSLIALKRWGRITAADLEAARPLR